MCIAQHTPCLALAPLLLLGVLLLVLFFAFCLGCDGKLVAQTIPVIAYVSVRGCVLVPCRLHNQSRDCLVYHPKTPFVNFRLIIFPLLLLQV
jgi:hypothetical protein